MDHAGAVVNANGQVQAVHPHVSSGRVNHRAEGAGSRIVRGLVMENLRGCRHGPEEGLGDAGGLEVNGSVAVDRPAISHYCAGTQLQVLRVEDLILEKRDGSDLNVLADGGGAIESSIELAGVGDDAVVGSVAADPGELGL